MAQFNVTLKEERLPVGHLRLVPVIETYCRELFPSDTQVTCNNTRVEAHIDLGAGVTANAIIDIDPVSGEDGVTRLTGSFNANGEALKETDQAAIEAMAAQLFNGVRGVVALRVRQLQQDPFDYGVG